MTKQHIEFVLSGYGVPFTDALADKLLEMFDEEAASYQYTINKLNKVLSENKGEWIYQEGVTPYKWRCNKCEKVFKTDFNFCPNCGADMREVSE